MTGDNSSSPFVRQLPRLAWRQQIFQSLAMVSGILIVAASTLVLAGWHLDIARLKSIVEGWASMKPNTAAAFIGVGLAICLGRESERASHDSRMSRACALFAALVGVLTLSEYLVGWDAGIDEILFKDSSGGAGLSPAGRMAPATAMNFVLLGTALALLDIKRHYWLVQVVALFATVLAFVAVLGYVYGVSALHKFGPFVSVAIHTATLFVLAGIAVVCLRPNKGLMEIVTSDSAGGAAARLLLPVAIFAPPILGWLRLEGQLAGLYDTAFGLAIFAASCVVVVSTVILWSAIKLHKTDLQRQRASVAFSRVVEATPNAMVMVDQTGRIVLVNQQTEKLFGRRREDLLGRTVEILVPTQSRERHSLLRDEFFRSPAARPMDRKRDLHGQRQDGSLFPVEIGLTPVVTDEGLLVLSAIVDITGRKVAEERERSRLAELAHAGRLSMLGEMVSGLAHEINQPLGAARNFANACVRLAQTTEGVSPEQIVDMMTKTAAQAERASEIVRRLNSFVKKDLSAHLPVDVNQVVRDVLTLTLPGFWPGQIRTDLLELRTMLDDSLPRISGDRVQIEQVLLNLTRNAVEAMKDCDADDQVLEIQTSKTDGFVKVMVSDRGPGLGADSFARLFEPFFTTKSDGVGLGLSISRSIIEAHSGRLWAEPNEGRGTRFAFTLPSAADQ